MCTGFKKTDNSADIIPSTLVHVTVNMRPQLSVQCCYTMEGKLLLSSKSWCSCPLSLSLSLSLCFFLRLALTYSFKLALANVFHTAVLYLLSGASSCTKKQNAGNKSTFERVRKKTFWLSSCRAWNYWNLSIWFSLLFPLCLDAESLVCCSHHDKPLFSFPSTFLYPSVCLWCRVAPTFTVP